MTAHHSTSGPPSRGYVHPTPAAQAPNRRPGRTKKTQLKLFQAALEIMSEKGPSSTTVDEVALKAGVSKGTVYYNFGSKKTMVEQLLQYGAQLLLQEIKAGWEGQADPRLAIQDAVYRAFTYLHNHPGFARLWIAEAWKESELWAEPLITARQQIIAEVEHMVRALSDTYRVDSTQDPSAIAVAIFGSTFMLTMDREVHAVARPVEAVTRTVMLLVDSYISA